MKVKKANRRDILNRIAFWVMLAIFWIAIAFQVAKVTKIVVLSVIGYSIINLYLSYELMPEKKRLGCFATLEIILFTFLGIIVIFQAII